MPERRRCVLGVGGVPCRAYLVPGQGRGNILYLWGAIAKVQWLVTVPKPVVKIKEIRDQTQYVRLGLLSVFVIVMALILPRSGSVRHQVHAGMTWSEEDLVAEMDFARMKSREQYEAEVQQARESVVGILRKDSLAPTRSIQHLSAAIKAMHEGLATCAGLKKGGNADLARTECEKWATTYGQSADSLLKESPNAEIWAAKFGGKLLNEASRIYHKGYADSSGSASSAPVFAVQQNAFRRTLTDKKTLFYRSSLIEAVVNSDAFSRLEIPIAQSLLTKHLEPSLVYDPKLVEESRKMAEANVLTVFGKIPEGHVIVRRGEVVTADQAAIIETYYERQEQKYGEPGFLKSLLAQLALIGMITVLMAFYMQGEWPRIYYRNRKLAFLLLLILLTMALVGLALKLTQLTRQEYGLNFIFLTPVCMVPIVLTAFFDSRLGFFGNLVTTIFIAMVAPNGVEYLFIQFCAGTIAVYSLRELRNRGDFFLSLFFVLLTYLVSYVGYNYFLQGGFGSIEWSNLALLGINVVLTIIAFPLIYLFERIFRLTSDMTYIELLDTNHPLLKDLAIKAPGTFQHSQQVAHIAEAVLNRIGGNALMTRVGALYHDIGKVKNPRYFIENLGDDDNPHAELSYEASAEIIIRHVTDGVKMGQENRLPHEIINFIRTHHGTSRVEYFYRRHLQDHPEDDEAEIRFTYPGPLPFSREMAVLMICDGCEAACRAMTHRTPESVFDLVDNIVKSKVKQNQFESANITFKDLEEIKQVVYQQLLSMYHNRIEYPAEAQ